MPTINRVVASPEEMRRAKLAEELLRKGEQNFESVYGPKTNSFDLAKELSEFEELTSQPDSPKPIAPEQKTKPKQVSKPTKQVQKMEQKEQEPTNEVAETEELEEELSPEEKIAKVAERLAAMDPNAPSAEVLKNWKSMHGDLFFLQLEDKVFIYRYLKRQEHIQLKSNPALEKLRDFELNDLLFDKCILWPKFNPVQKAALPAGTIDLLVQQINIQSLFLDPAYVAQMTFKI